jgi:pyrroline-5-carboxylate reductase
MYMDTIGFIGVGNMGSAILKGIAGSSLKQETSLFAYNRGES